MINNLFLDSIDCVKIDGEEFRLNDGSVTIDIEYEEIAPGFMTEQYVTVEFESDSEIFKKMDNSDRTHGSCIYCADQFHLTEHYVTFGGGNFCDEDCLAQFAVDIGKDVEDVERDLCHHNRDRSV